MFTRDKYKTMTASFLSIILSALILMICGIFSCRDAVHGNVTQPNGSKEMDQNNNSLSEKILKQNFEFLADISMSDLTKEQQPSSDWIESNKTFFHDLLKNSTFDILIVPFQVQGYAIDRVGRSLITRYLVNRIEVSTELKAPCPTLVARALGENSRSFEDNEVYKLANDLNVRILIRGYVGHKRDEKMMLSLLIQEREDKEPLSPETRMTTVHWQDIPFSDEHPPSEVFLGHIDKVMAKLPIKPKAEPTVSFYKRTGELPIPETILELVNRAPDSPLISAYHLQMLGMLFPEQTAAKEHLFERSLVALTSISPKSPDYAVLKARAYFYLYRRPAALTALGTASTVEENALLALLNGNLSKLEKLVSEIRSPINKLMSQIELNDLNWSYKKEADKGRVETSPDWEMIVTRRMQQHDRWDIQSNLDVKQKLDAIYPIPGFTVEDLARSQMALGEIHEEGDDIVFSAYNHYRRYLRTHWDRYVPMANSWCPEEIDYMDLLYAISESNLLKGILLTLSNKALPDSALDRINQYEAIYRGHTEMTYLKGAALRKLSRTKGGDAATNLKQQAKQEIYKAYYWSQGQTEYSKGSVWTLSRGTPPPFLPPSLFIYDADYPRRWFWPSVISKGGDREVLENSYSSRYGELPVPEFDKHTTKNRELAVRYTHDNLKTMKDCYDRIAKLKTQLRRFPTEIDFDRDAAELYKSNQHRFIGHPDLISFIADHKEIPAQSADKKPMYEKAITADPWVWQSYFELAKLYIKDGDFQNAVTTFQRFPLFQDGETNDRIKMSNYALTAGLELWWLGAFEEAIPLLRLAANSATGSGAEMASSKVLALLDGDYHQAAYHSLQALKRYNNRYGCRDYLALLHLMGFHKEAWSLFNTLEIQTYAPQILTGAFIGQRMESTDSKEILKWLNGDHMSKVSFNDAIQYIMMFHLIDRPFDTGSDKIIEEVVWRGDGQTPSNVHIMSIKKQFSEFARGYYMLKEKNFHDAYEIFRRNNYLTYDSVLYQYAVPYMHWSAAKNKSVSEMEDYINENLIVYNNKEEADDSFVGHLSQAIINGVNRNHTKAINDLKLASYRIPVDWTHVLSSGWYQLVEISEWLYQESGNSDYKKLALYWAKKFQKIRPMFAWAFAVEANYTDSISDRQRALALALYLDKNSERISQFSEEDKKEALEWLKTNNPFLNNATEKRHEANNGSRIKKASTVHLAKNRHS